MLTIIIINGYRREGYEQGNLVFSMDGDVGFGKDENSRRNKSGIENGKLEV